jgi:integrase
MNSHEEAPSRFPDASQAHHMKLDHKTVAALRLSEGKADVIHFDDAMPGFGYRLRASTGGDVRRSWIVQYRRAGASRRLLLGSAEVLNADQARAAAKKALAEIALGGDPQAEKATRRSADKFILSAVVEEFLAAKEGTVRPRTFTEAQRYLSGPHFKPLHAMPVGQIARRDVAARLLTIARERGAVTAARARSCLSDLYSWAMGQGLVEANPVVGTNRPKTAPPRDRVLNNQELAAIWREAGDDDFARVVRLLILTAQRRTEVGGMAWPELNLERGTWTIPSERTKNKRAHTLPLPPLALDIIAGLPRVVGRDYLFGSRAAGFTSWHHPKQVLDKRLADQVEPWRLHDLRRSAATRMCDLGVAPHVVEQILNHQSGHRGGIVGVYNRSSYEREVRAAMAMWADHVRSIVEGGEHKVLAYPQASA